MIHHLEFNPLIVRFLRTGLPVAVSLVLLVPLLSARAGAAESACDPGLASESSDPRSYRMRENNRCEGMYRLKVNSDKLRLRSWTVSFENYDPAGPEPLELSWQLPPGSREPVHLRATALKPDTYYRMDAEVPGLRGPWHWDTTFLEQLGLNRADLGLLGWTSFASLNTGEQKIYLPLEVRQKQAPRPESYRVVLVPGERLTEVSWSIAPLSSSGETGPPLAPPRELGYGYYPARRPTEFSFPMPAEPGLYVLKLRAKLRSEPLPATRDIFFYHPGLSSEIEGRVSMAPANQGSLTEEGR